MRRLLAVLGAVALAAALVSPVSAQTTLTTKIAEVDYGQTITYWFHTTADGTLSLHMTWLGSGKPAPGSGIGYINTSLVTGPGGEDIDPGCSVVGFKPIGCALSVIAPAGWYKIEVEAPRADAAPLFNVKAQVTTGAPVDQVIGP